VNVTEVPKPFVQKCIICGDRNAQYSSRNTGVNGACIRCGGGDRCEQECCTPFPERLYAYLYHPDTGEGMCTLSARVMVDDAMAKNNVDEFKRLMDHFKFKRHLVIRAEHAFYFAINKVAPDLRELEHAIDEGVLHKFFDKPKDIKEKRPDVFYLHRSESGRHSGLHLEYDETPSHEDNDDRLNELAEKSGCFPADVYVVRVNGCHKTQKELCKRHSYNSTQEDYNRHDYYVKMKQGIMPRSAEEKKRYFN